MKVYEYEDKESKEKARAADILSVLADMDELEQFNGATESKILENWYQLKRDLRDALLAEIPKEEKK